jgi:hypothetical protein
LEAAGPPGRAAASVAAAPGARRSDVASGAARRGVHSRACLEAAHSDDRLLLSHLEGEGEGSPEEDSIGAVVEGEDRENHAGPRQGRH